MSETESAKNAPLAANTGCAPSFDGAVSARAAIASHVTTAAIRHGFVFIPGL
jgi:hypothetical protein